VKRFLLVLFVALSLTIFTLYRLDGFSVAKIEGPLAKGEAESLEEIHLVQQPYYYLAKGRQCFAFVSADGKTVIKFLNYDRFTLPPVLKDLPQLKAYRKKRESRFQATLDSFQLAWEFLQKETGLFYAHLQGGGKLPHLTLIDRGKRLHSIDLNQVVFILQKRAVPIYEELEKSGVEPGIDAFLLFLQKRIDKGIADDDRDVGINFGFSKGEPMLIDPGRLYLLEGLHTEEGRSREMKGATRCLRKWLLQKHPEAVSFLDRRVDEIRLGVQ
jgi:hypothetical protein